MRITRSKPERLLGAYPQDLLWGQVGSAPTRNRTSTTSNTVEMVIGTLPACQKAGLWLKSKPSWIQLSAARAAVLWGEHLMVGSFGKSPREVTFRSTTSGR
jgi:hypothetical protein